ncbi:hypothetical protein AYL99_10506 [Fonsecaea erecta]|uniref:BRCT domain-containing protein n=1 Tax=Fonsecaea erecta TaxID=1367422 RepID=A0A178Z8N0_9EURO|nr:hypothetical protein AYL99_10506 [Fonsecaea erecta]OAP55533.1 hypothetical protein AYL99_10506 [Fonsecaea erecta]
MATISLVYFTAVGSEVCTELPIDGGCATFYLPDNPAEDALILSPSIDERHSNICLEVHRTFVLLRTFNTTAGPCCVLGDDGINIELPLSTASHHKSIILGTNTHIMGPSGRWGLRWGDVDGADSYSRRLPPLPPVTECVGTPLATEKEFQEEVDVGAVTGDAASGDSVMPCMLPDADKLTSTVFEKPPAHDRRPQSARDTIDAPSGSSDVQEIFRGKDDATALSAFERRRGKRKLGDIDNAESSLELVRSQFSPRDDGVSTDRSTTGINSPKKKTQTGTQKRQGTKQSTKQSNPREALTETNAKPQRSLPDEQSSPMRRMARGNESTSPTKYTVAVAPVVIFSGSTSIQEKRAAMQTFERLGGKVSTEITKSTILCIPEGPLKRTGKLIMAVAMGIDIVTEKWIADAHRLGRFQAIEEYLPLDRSRERQWGFNLRDAIGRGKAGLTHLLSGTTIFLTKQLRTDLGNLEREISQIATVLGADAVKHRLPALKDKAKFSEAEIFIIGMPGDPQGAHVEKLGHTLFNKDVLTMAALRGRVDRDSAEFRIEIPTKDEVVKV